jgi:hypothetical protein
VTPQEDPVASLEIEWFRPFEKLAAELPGRLAAGSVRRVMEQSLPLPSPPAGPASATSLFVGTPACRTRVDGSEGVQSADGLVSAICHSKPQLEWAAAVLCFLAHGYVWGEHGSRSLDTVDSIPATIAVPLCAVAAVLKRPPLLTYSSFNLHNWRRLDPEQPVALGNTARLLNFLGGYVCCFRRRFFVFCSGLKGMGERRGCGRVGNEREGGRKQE